MPNHAARKGIRARRPRHAAAISLSSRASAASRGISPWFCRGRGRGRGRSSFIPHSAFRTPHSRGISPWLPAPAEPRRSRVAVRRPFRIPPSGFRFRSAPPGAAASSRGREPGDPKPPPIPRAPDGATEPFRPCRGFVARLAARSPHSRAGLGGCTPWPSKGLSFRARPFRAEPRNLAVAVICAVAFAVVVAYCRMPIAECLPSLSASNLLDIH